MKQKESDPDEPDGAVNNPNNCDYEIKIEYENGNEANASVAYESDLKDIAKYLVDEITQISVNKVKIDSLNETLNKKYFSHDLLTKHEILTSLISNTESEPVAIPAAIVHVNTENKSREELFDYYTNLERNLQSVREEIDKLKQEAFEDLAYINEILTNEDHDNTLDMISGLDMCNEADIQLDNEYENKINLLSEQNNALEREFKAADLNLADLHEMTKSQETIVCLQADEEQPDDEEEEDDETQYLSQQTNDTTTTTNGSQIFMTPAESWQTLKNLDNLQVDLAKTPYYMNAGGIELDEENQTDLDEDNQHECDEEEEEEEEEDATSLTITLDPTNYTNKGNAQLLTSESLKNSIL